MAWTSRFDHLSPATLYQDDAWVALGWRAQRWIDLQRAGLSSPGFTLLVRFWLNAIGFTNQNARWLPFLVGLIVSPVFLLTALRLRLRPAAAVLGATMLVASPTLSTYSVRVKQYTLEVVLATALVGVAWLVIERPASPRRWAALGGLSAACCFISFPLTGVVAGALAAGCLAAWSRLGLRRAVRSWAVPTSAATLAVIALLYAIVVKPALASPSLNAFWRPNYPTYHFPGRQRLSGRTDHGTLSKFWSLLLELFRQALWGLPWLMVLVYGVSLAVLILRRPLFAVLLSVPVVLAVITSFAQLSPLGGGRTDAYLYAPIVFTIVAAADVLLRRLQRIPLPKLLTASTGSGSSRPGIRARANLSVALVGAIGLLAVTLALGAPAPGVTSLPPVIDTMPLIASMEAQADPRDVIVVGTSQFFVYPLYSKHRFRTVRDTRAPGSFRPVLVGADVLAADAFLAAARSPRRVERRLTDTVWVIDSPGADSRSTAAATLERLGYRLVRQQVATGAILEHWQRLSTR